MAATAGQYVTDGTAIFIIRDTRDCTPVGRPVTDDILRDSYVKRNGALLQRSGYPTIVQFMITHPELVTTEANWQNAKNMYTWGDGTASSGTTIRVPDDRGLYEQLSDGLGLVAAGLPNATGEFANGGIATATGVFVVKSSFSGVGDHSQPNYTLDFNLSRASSIYGNSTTVTPPSVRRIVQMKY